MTTNSALMRSSELANFHSVCSLSCISVISVCSATDSPTGTNTDFTSSFSETSGEQSETVFQTEISESQTSLGFILYTYKQSFLLIFLFQSFPLNLIDLTDIAKHFILMLSRTCMLNYWTKQRSSLKKCRRISKDYQSINSCSL